MSIDVFHDPRPLFSMCTEYHTTLYHYFEDALQTCVLFLAIGQIVYISKQVSHIITWITLNHHIPTVTIHSSPPAPSSQAHYTHRIVGMNGVFDPGDSNY